MAETLRYTQAKNDLAKQAAEMIELKALIEAKNKCESEQRAAHTKLVITIMKFSHEK